MARAGARVMPFFSESLRMVGLQTIARGRAFGKAAPLMAATAAWVTAALVVGIFVSVRHFLVE